MLALKIKRQVLYTAKPISQRSHVKWAPYIALKQVLVSSQCIFQSYEAVNSEGPLRVRVIHAGFTVPF